MRRSAARFSMQRSKPLRVSLGFEAQWDFTGGTSTDAFHPPVSPHFEHLPFVQTTYKHQRLVVWLNWGLGRL